MVVGDENTQGVAEAPIGRRARPVVPPRHNPPIVPELLPERVFATDRYPLEGRINSYSKPEYLLDIVDVLQGTDEFLTLKNSPLGSLFDLPIRKSSLSGKLVHSILCRSLHTAKRHEMWFVFGGQPIRFSLREFALVTGLPCGPYSPAEVIRAAQKPKAGEEPYWNTLFDAKTKCVSIIEIVNRLRRDHRLPVKDQMPAEKKLRLCLIVIVEGILICNSQPVRASTEVVEMVKDLETFFSYPWGRESFELTLRMVKVGTKINSVDELVDKLMQSHAATHGFILSLQLLILHSIPMLDNYLPDTEDELTFTDRSIVQLSKLKTFHNTNIIEAENNPDLVVYPIIDNDDEDIRDFSWGDELPDPGVNYLVSLINRRYTFTKEVWHGGFEGMALIPLPRPNTYKKGKNVTKHREKVWTSDKDPVFVGESSNSNLLDEVQVRLADHTELIRGIIASEWSSIKAEFKVELKNEVKAEIKAEIFQSLLESGQCVKSSKVVDELPNGNAVDLNTVDNSGFVTLKSVDQVNNSFWEDYAGVPDVLASLKTSEAGPSRMRNDDLSNHVLFNTGIESGDNNMHLSTEKVGVDAAVDTPDAGDVHPLEEESGSQLDKAASADEELGDEAFDVGDQSCKPDGEDGEAVDQTNPGRILENLSTTKEHRDADDSSDRDSQEPVGTDGIEFEDNNKKHGEVANQGDCAEKTVEESTHSDGSDEEDLEQHGEGANQGDCAEKTVEESTHSDGSDEEDLEQDTDDIDNSNLSSMKDQQLGSTRKRTLTSDGNGVAVKRVKRVPSRFRSTPHQKIGDGMGGSFLPLAKIAPAKKKKFLAKLAAYRRKEYIIDGHSVENSFFNDILTPRNWVNSTHMEALLSLTWRKLGDEFMGSRIALLDTWFTEMLCNEYPRFKKWKKDSFQWNSLCKNYVRGIVPTRSGTLIWFENVDNIYIPMNWRKGHWVALVIQLKEGNILILDPLISGNDSKKLKKFMKPVVDMLPVLLSDQFANVELPYPIPSGFTYERIANLSQNDRTGDCGPFAVKLMELHALGLPLEGITPAMVDQFRLKYAIDVYEEFVGPIPA